MTKSVDPFAQFRDPAPCCSHCARRPKEPVTVRADFFGCCNLSALVSTTGPHGGDSSNTTIKLIIDPSACIGLKVIADGRAHEFSALHSSPLTIELDVHGDSEACTMFGAFEFVNDHLGTCGFGPSKPHCDSCVAEGGHCRECIAKGGKTHGR